MDPYFSSGYKTDRGREQARAFKQPGSQFLAPGYPVEVAPPPPPPAGVAVGAGAAAGAAGAAVPLALVGTVIAGVALGLSVKKDIDKFKAKSKSPWYDTDYVYTPGEHLKQAWVPSKFDEVLPYDYWADYFYQEHIDELIDDWWNDVFRSEMLNSTYTPVWLETGPSGWYSRYYQYRRCPSKVPTGLFGTTHALNTHTVPPAAANGLQACPGSILSGVVNARATPELAMITSTYPPGQQFIYRLRSGVNPGIAESWSQVQSAYWPTPFFMPSDSSQIWRQGVVYGDRVLVGFVGDVSRPARSTWANGVAPQGTQPSLDEQLADTKLPHGRSRYGYVVPFSLGHPFTIIRPRPGSPPVTVPDQVIDPGSETEPGSVTIVPPGMPPGAESDSGRYSQKPRAQRLAHLGFVAINVATETQDFVEAMHKGLPKHLRSKGVRGSQVPPWVILQDIWDHWDEFDSQVALEAFINNQIEDAIYGRFFGAVSRTQKRLGVTQGLSRATRIRSPWNISIVVPEVHFAHGQHSIEWATVTIQPE